MSAFKLLKTGDEPFIKEGQHIRFRGKMWDPSIANKTFEVIKTQITHFRIDHGIFSTSGDNSKKTFTVDKILRPDKQDTVFEIRLSLIGSGVLYIRFPEGQIRGGLEKGIYTSPNPDNVVTRLLGEYTEEDTQNHKLQVFEAYGGGPDFELRSFMTDTKLIFDLIINKMKIRETPDWDGEVIYIDDYEVMV